MAALVVVSVDEFFVESAEKRLGGGVIPTHPGPSHRLCDAISPAQLSGSPELGLAAAVGVEYHTSNLSAAGPDRFAQRISDERGFHVRCHRDADHSAGRQVQNERQVQEPLPGPDVGDVAHPGFIRCRSGELTPE